MSSKPSRPVLLLLLPLMVILFILLLGCAPCCCWFPGGGGNNGNGNGATVTGSAYIEMTGPKEPVPGVQVTLGKYESKTSEYKTTTDSNGYFKITGIEPGTYFIRIAGGDLGWSDTINIKKDASLNLGDIQLHPTLPPPPTDADKYPTTPEEVIKAYYKAINEGNFSKALSYVAGQLGGQEEDNLKGSYDPYVKNIGIVAIERKPTMDYSGRTIYEVTFSADYIKHYPAGSGDLPTVHAMQQVDGLWKIVDIGTG